MAPRRRSKKAGPPKTGFPKTGGVLIWKPVGITSRDAVDQAERTLAGGPLGHTGTLDPLAEGLLLLLGGEARKFQALLTDHDKAYRASVTFGIQSISDDGEGPLFCPVPRLELPDRDRLENALDRFRGGYEQIPPGHSAIRIDGQRAWKRVRRGETVTMPARAVKISRCDLVSFDGTTATIDVACGSGTYIRSLARDLGDELGCGAYLSGLARTELGGLSADEATPLDALTPEHWGSLESLVTALPRIEVDDAARDRLALGQRVPIPALPDEPDATSTAAIPRVLWCGDEVVGLGELRGKVVQPRRWIRREATPESERDS